MKNTTKMMISTFERLNNLFKERYNILPFLNINNPLIVKYRYLAVSSLNVRDIIKYNTLLDQELKRNKIDILNELLKEERINYNNYSLLYFFKTRKNDFPLYLPTGILKL